MVKEGGGGGGRKCSYCGIHGHNTRTCSNGKSVGLKLFGVNIIEEHEKPMQKSVSLGNLDSFKDKGDDDDHHDDVDDGYLSDGFISSRRFKAAHAKKKGIPWTEEEHRVFLRGLKRLGKGDWRGISKNFVTTRTPTQVASHAQKYFLRQSSSDKKRRRSSLFDMTLKESVPESQPRSPSAFPVTTSNANAQAQVVSRFPLCLDRSIPMANPSFVSSVFPSYPGIPILVPYTAGFPGNELGAKAMQVPSLLEVVNYNDSNQTYPNPFKNPASFTNHPSGIPAPRNYMQQVPSSS